MFLCEDTHLFTWCRTYRMNGMIGFFINFTCFYTRKTGIVAHFLCKLFLCLNNTFLITTVQYFCYRLLASSKSVRREQEAADDRGRRVEAKCGIDENNEGDRHDNDNDDNEDHVENDVEMIAYSQTPCTRAVFFRFAAAAKKPSS